MIAELIEKGISTARAQGLTDSSLNQEIETLLAIQHEQIETIGLMLEANAKKQLEQMPDNYLESVGHLLQFHTLLARQFANSINKCAWNFGG